MNEAIQVNIFNWKLLIELFIKVIYKLYKQEVSAFGISQHLNDVSTSLLSGNDRIPEEEWCKYKWLCCFVQYSAAQREFVMLDSLVGLAEFKRFEWLQFCHSSILNHEGIKIAKLKH